MSEEQNNNIESESDSPEVPDPQADANAPADAGGGSLEEQLEATRNERDENNDRFLRAQADLENYKRRAQRELSEERLYAALPVVRDLLPVIDNFQRALDAARSSEQATDLVEGLDMVIRQLGETLSRHGTTPISAVGEPFDPNLHEAVQQIPSADHPPMTVLQELERGYVLHDRVVRPTKVIVSTTPVVETESSEENDAADQSADSSHAT